MKFRAFLLFSFIACDTMSESTLNTGTYTIISYTYGGDTQSGNYSLNAGNNTINIKF